ncbi:MAG: PKD domain-containing protein [Pseudomonadota bacterium]
MNTTTKTVGRWVRPWLRAAVVLLGVVSALGSAEFGNNNDDNNEEPARSVITLSSDTASVSLEEGQQTVWNTKAEVTTEERLTSVTYEAMPDDDLAAYVEVTFVENDEEALDVSWTLQLDPRVAPGVYEVDVRSTLRSNTGANIASSGVSMMLTILPPDRGEPAPSAVDVLAASDFSLALLEDGTVWSWGTNRDGQLAENGRLDVYGDGIDRYVPGPIEGLRDVVAMAAGGLIVNQAGKDGHVLALLADGTVVGWGANEDGQIGGGELTVLHQPVTIGGVTGVIAVEAGWGFSLALLEDGTVLAWGRNHRGQLGDGTTESRSQPAPVIGLPPIRALAAGEDHTVALAEDGSVWGWGTGVNGAAGGDLCCPDAQPVPVRVQGVDGAVGVRATASGSLALMADGRVLAWGAGFAVNGGALDPVRPIDAFSVPEVFGSSDGVHLIAIDGGEALAWGFNREGQLGDGSVESRSEVRAVPGLSQGISAVSAGGDHSLALARSGDCGFLWSWGNNTFGQLGDGAQTHERFQFQGSWSSNNVGSRARPHLVRGIGEQDCSALAVIIDGEGTVTSDGGELRCDTPICSGVFAPGELVTLTAQPAPLMRVDAWGGDCEGVPPGGDATQVQVLADRHQTCTVSFVLDADANPPPTAAFTVTPNVPEVNQAVALDASASTDDSAIVSYEWDFEDDGTFDTTGVTATTAYTEVGTFSIRLRVTDDDGLADETTEAVTVIAPGSFFSLTVNFTGVGEGTVEITPLGIVLPDPQYCVEDTCTVDLLPNAGVFDLIPRAEGLNFFIGWVDEQCDSQNFFTGACTVVMTGDRTVTAEFLSE